MVSYKVQRLVIVLTLFISTVFLYGCNGGTPSSSLSEASIQIEVRDVTTKAALDNVQVMISGPDPANAQGAVSILRQVATDSRGKATLGSLPPDRTYTVNVYKEGYQNPPNVPNAQPQYIPTNIFLVEQGKSYDVIAYLVRSDSPTTGTIKGYVKNRVTGEAITNATVYNTPVGNVASVIDTTDKPSKPGYYELNNVPSGQVTVNVTIPGIAANVTANVTIPSNGSIDYDFMVDPGTGSLHGNIVAAANETLAPGNYIVQALRNGTDVIATVNVNVTAGGGAGGGAAGGSGPKSQEFTIASVPIILPGSTATYTVKVVADVAHMINPAGGVSGIVLRPAGGAAANVIEVSPITVQAEKGTVLVTLFHPIITNVLAGESEATLSVMAPQATITVDGALVETIFVNEGPTRFYRYRINNVPVGSRNIRINFPGHNVSGTPSVTAVKDTEVQVLYTLAEGAGGGGAAPKLK